jgi:ketosteroid isomerase-like protein
MSVESIVDAHMETWNAPAGPAREKAIAQVYTEDVVVNEPDARLTGYAGVEQAITALQTQLAGMAISRSGPLREVQDLVTYPWTVSAEGGPAIASGHDVLIIRDGKVSSLYVLINS